MIRMQFLAPVFLALTVGATGAGAQEVEEATPAPAQPEATPGPQATDSDSAASSGKATTDESPFDYQASEQISEDLSVSFPVDI